MANRKSIFEEAFESFLKAIEDMDKPCEKKEVCRCEKCGKPAGECRCDKEEEPEMTVYDLVTGCGNVLNEVIEGVRKKAEEARRECKEKPEKKGFMEQFFDDLLAAFDNLGTEDEKAEGESICDVCDKNRFDLIEDKSFPVVDMDDDRSEWADVDDEDEDKCEDKCDACDCIYERDSKLSIAENLKRFFEKNENTKQNSIRFRMEGIKNAIINDMSPVGNGGHIEKNGDIYELVPEDKDVQDYLNNECTFTLMEALKEATGFSCIWTITQSDKPAMILFKE